MDGVLDLARRRASTLAEADDALTVLRGRACSADGAAEVVVDGGGRLVSLTLAESVTALTAARIAALVVDTERAAARDALARRHAVLDDLTADLGR